MILACLKQTNFLFGQPIWIGTKFADCTLNGAVCHLFCNGCLVFSTGKYENLDTSLHQRELFISYGLIYGMLPLQQMEKLHQRYLYRITTLLLSIFLVVIIANRHMGLSSYQQSYAVCTQRVVELTERAGAFEESSTKSLTVIKQLEESMAIYSERADQAVKDKEKSKKQLEKYQFFQNMSLLDRDKRELNVKLIACSDQLAKCAQEADELEAKLSDAAKEKDRFVHNLKHEKIRYHVLSRNNVAISKQLTMCNEQLDECKLSKQEMKTAEEFKFNVLIIFIVVVVGMMGALVTVSVFRSNKQNK